MVDKLNHTRDKIVKTLVKAGDTLKDISQEELPQLKREWFENSEVMQGIKERWFLMIMIAIMQVSHLPIVTTISRPS